MSDKALLEKLLAGDEGGLKRFYEELHPQMASLAAQFLAGDDPKIETIIQDAMSHSLHRLKDYRTTIPLATWAGRFVVQACVEELAKRKEAYLENKVQLDGWPQPVSADMPEAVKRAVIAEVEQLEPLSQQAVKLRDLEGKTILQLSAAMDVGPGEAMDLLARGREALVKRLEPRKKIFSVLWRK